MGIRGGHFSMRALGIFDTVAGLIPREDSEGGHEGRIRRAGQR